MVIAQCMSHFPALASILYSLLQPLVEFFGISDVFPLSRQLISRSLDIARPKRLYFVCTPIHDMMVKDEKEQLRIAATGLKVWDNMLKLSMHKGRNIEKIFIFVHIFKFLHELSLCPGPLNCNNFV